MALKFHANGCAFPTYISPKEFHVKVGDTDLSVPIPIFVDSSPEQCVFFRNPFIMAYHKYKKFHVVILWDGRCTVYTEDKIVFHSTQLDISPITSYFSIHQKFAILGSDEGYLIANYLYIHGDELVFDMSNQNNAFVTNMNSHPKLRADVLSATEFAPIIKVDYVEGTRRVIKRINFSSGEELYEIPGKWIPIQGTMNL